MTDHEAPLVSAISPQLGRVSNFKHVVPILIARLFDASRGMRISHACRRNRATCVGRMSTRNLFSLCQFHHALVFRKFLKTFIMTNVLPALNRGLITKTYKPSPNPLSNQRKTLITIPRSCQPLNIPTQTSLTDIFDENFPRNQPEAIAV